MWETNVTPVLVQVCRTSTARCQRQPLKRPRTGVLCCLCLRFHRNIFKKTISTGFGYPQKYAMLDIDGLVHLHDIVCLWIWLRERLQRAFPMETVEKYEKLFQKGLLGCVSHTPAENFGKFGWGVIWFSRKPVVNFSTAAEKAKKLAGV